MSPEVLRSESEIEDMKEQMQQQQALQQVAQQFINQNQIKTTKHKISLPKTNYRVVLPQLNTLQLNNKRNEPKRTTRTLQESI